MRCTARWESVVLVVVFACGPAAWPQDGAATMGLSGPTPSPTPRSTKSHSTFYGEQARRNAIANAARYDWASRQVAEAVAAASPWVALSDDELWRRIFGHELHRALTVSQGKGCPLEDGTFLDIGDSQWAWTALVPGEPWKIQCPANGDLYPKNDFGAFYESGISPIDGFFHYDLADRSLLYNTEHPDPADPLHDWCVDDGRGWQRFPGGPRERDWYIGYHVLAGYWRETTNGIRALAEAYALSSDPLYAHKCAVLLDRLADEFPNYDGSQQLYTFSGYWPGIIGPNYWDGGMWEQRALDYDKIYDGIGAHPATLAFLGAKSRQYQVPLPKESADDIRYSIEQRILLETGRHPDRIDMNGAATEVARSTVDFVLRGEAATADFLDRVLPLLVPPQHLNPDGSGNERSLGYDSGAFSSYCTFVERMAGFDLELARAIFERSPTLRAAFDLWIDLFCLDAFTPNIGDTGFPGEPWGPAGTAGAYLVLYELTGEARYAQAALRVAGNDAAALPRNIYADDPEGLVARAVAAASAAGPLDPPSVVKPYLQLGILRAGADEDRVALYLFYSPRRGTSSHSHFDALNIGLYAHGVEMVVEQAYPLWTGDWPGRWNWTSHTRSHATVLVDGANQTQCDGGALLGFAGRHGVQLLSAAAPCVYGNVSVYRRTTLLIEPAPDRCFALDVFRVEGGRQHTYTIPIFYGEPQTSGLVFSVTQATLYDGYLEQARIGTVIGPWWVDIAVRRGWQDSVAGHLRVHGPAAPGELVLAQGETRLGDEAPERFPYILLRRQGATDSLASTFVAAYEPYRTQPFLADGALAVNESNDTVTVDVTLDRGRYTFALHHQPAATTVDVEAELDGRTESFTLSGTDGPTP